MAGMGLIRVLTVDSRPIIHAGVRQLLANFPDIVFVGAAFDREEAFVLARSWTPDIVLIESDDLGQAWPDALRRLVRERAGAVVVFTMAATEEGSYQMLQAGVQGVLLKGIQPFTLAQALRGIAAGQQVFDPEVTRAALTMKPGSRTTEGLSSRERDVLALLANGLSNHEISHRLCVSQATVKFHYANIFGKLGVRTRAQAVAVAYTHQLIPRVVVDREPVYFTPRRVVS
ncbi:MAG: response regulator transcription factor [Chloroflexales bacterium]|nr:response regulator transcription factor [Chloroflexales bacterium]